MRATILKALGLMRGNAKFLTYCVTQHSFSHESNGVGERTLDKLFDDVFNDFDPHIPDEVVLDAQHDPILRSSGSKMSKVSTTLRQLVRDWTTAGATERDQCYGPIYAELERVVPITEHNRNKLMMFIPGSGLSRLMAELCA